MQRRGGGNVRLGDADDTVTVNTSMWGLEFIHTRGGNDVVDASASKFNVLRTGEGEDTVTTGAIWVEMISTGDDNDHITVGTGGTGLVRAGGGDDIIVVHELDAFNGFAVQGGSGRDLLDFSSFSTGLTFTLDGVGIFQNVGAPGGDISVPAVGYFAEGSVEDIIGSSQADKLTGDANANSLVGGSGSDQLFGGDGGDDLIGGGGNDKLRGGDGVDTLVGGGGKDNIRGGKGKDKLAGEGGNDILRGEGGDDTFIFGDNSGTDRIQDFAIGDDVIRISDHSGGFGSLAISNVSGDLQIVYDGGTIVLDNLAGAAISASDFEFV